MCLLLLVWGGVESVKGTNFIAIQSGYWNDGATWGHTSPGVAGTDYPNSTDNASISSSTWSVSVFLRTNTTCSNITFDNGGALILNGYNFTSTGTTTLNNQNNISGTSIGGILTLGGGLSMQDGGGFSYINTTGYNIIINGALSCPNQDYVKTNGGNLTINGNLSCGKQGFVTTGNGNITVNGNVNITTNASYLDIGSGNLNITGDFTCDGANTYITWTNGNVTIGGNISYSFQYSTSAFNCTGSGWLIMNGTLKSFTLNNDLNIPIKNFRLGTSTIIKAGSGKLTISSSFDLNNQTSFTQSAGTIDVTGTVTNFSSMAMAYVGTPTFSYSGGGDIVGGNYYNLIVQSTDISILCGTTVNSVGTFTNSRAITGPTTAGYYAKVVNTNPVTNSGTIGASSSYIAFSKTISGGTIGTNVLQNSSQTAQCISTPLITTGTITGSPFCA
jgi:hypothetical protein